MVLYYEIIQVSEAVRECEVEARSSFLAFVSSFLRRTNFSMEKSTCSTVVY